MIEGDRAKLLLAAQIYPMDHDVRLAPVLGAQVRGFLPHEEDLRSALRNDPYSTNLLLNMVEVQMLNGNAPVAQMFLTRALALRPKFSLLGDLRHTQNEGISLTD